jgi:hypothetical protein
MAVLHQSFGSSILVPFACFTFSHFIPFILICFLLYVSSEANITEHSVLPSQTDKYVSHESRHTVQARLCLAVEVLGS